MMPPEKATACTPPRAQAREPTRPCPIAPTPEPEKKTATPRVAASHPTPSSPTSAALEGTGHGEARMTSGEDGWRTVLGSWQPGHVYGGGEFARVVGPRRRLPRPRAGGDRRGVRRRSPPAVGSRRSSAETLRPYCWQRGKGLQGGGRWGRLGALTEAKDSVAVA